jgi:hypothetical protein
MQWESRTVTAGSNRTVVIHATTAGATAWPELREQFAQVWNDIADALASSPAQQWNAIVCSIRPDSGRALIVPCPRPQTWNADPAMTWHQVSLPRVEVLYNELPDVDTQPIRFEFHHDDLMKKAFDAMLAPLRGPLLNRLRQLRPFELWRCEYEDTVGMRLVPLPT